MVYMPHIEYTTFNVPSYSGLVTYQRFFLATPLL